MKAIVLFSGGQDSTTCLAWAKKNYDEVLALTFSYRQKHEIELIQAEEICRILEIPWFLIDISFYAEMAESSLIIGGGDFMTRHPKQPNLPSTWVPNRNALFLLLAHTFAQKHEARAIVIGINQIDYSGYPDCRDYFLEAMMSALNAGSGLLTDNNRIGIIAPLLRRSKGQIFEMAAELGILELIIEESHTCYRGNRDRIHDWGRGCGECDACNLRRAGWLEFRTSQK